MKHIASILALVASILLPASLANAAVLGVYSYDYTNGGNGDAQGRNQNANGVRITDDGTTFRDSFNFSDLAGDSIDSFALTFSFSGAGPLLTGNGQVEQWITSVEGSDPSGTGDDLFATLFDGLSPWTGTISALTAAGNTFFADALANLAFDFSFEQVGNSSGRSFRLASASLTVNGTAAVVPLPMPGLLLLMALGSLLVMRRRQAIAVV